ncbi:hypothetical protein PUNSTDRAFT_130664 [Punctularia strigosozonata HHB-11173 SS5]|uniref:uncharacterized protein n=1 Tax=Punctularia strigosozonata (strain HHB-11173) TaxID=741275 RepID=UPI0004417E87|nr:uncharacterized protein PUNSTDRAFT_130664 [Punctularia strigosozonata HHB-11173 SS5]EIN12411.1 hypothetical protein PUNSTDRAFT_130664 [Punctularia strigosozonata HHB-11173 SS5]
MLFPHPKARKTPPDLRPEFSTLMDLVTAADAEGKDAGDALERRRRERDAAIGRALDGISFPRATSVRQHAAEYGTPGSTDIRLSAALVVWSPWSLVSWSPGPLVPWSLVPWSPWSLVLKFKVSQNRIASV